MVQLALAKKAELSVILDDLEAIEADFCQAVSQPASPCSQAYRTPGARSQVSQTAPLESVSQTASSSALPNSTVSHHSHVSPTAPPDSLVSPTASSSAQPCPTLHSQVSTMASPHSSAPLTTICHSPSSHASPPPYKRCRTIESRIVRDAAGHQVKPPGCLPSCQYKCNEYNEEERLKLNKQFWSLNKTERSMWLRTNLQPISTEKSCPKENQRETRLYWQLPRFTNQNMSSYTRVCKRFFLTTLGWGATSDKAVLAATRPTGSIVPKDDLRGKRTPANKLDDALIRSHIESFGPCEPHYRLLHAPKRLYLPCDITIQSMHADYCACHGTIGIESYRKQVQKMNISFTKLGHEECELCTSFNIHTKEVPDCNSCTICLQQPIHQSNLVKARTSYRADADRSWAQGEIVVSADLMKVLVLPILPQKEAIFVSRLVTYNETFSLLVPQKPHIKDAKRDSDIRDGQAAILWHEGAAGRNGEDICSAFHRFMVLNKHRTKITIWMDNCGAQNKQWALFTLMVYVVNSEDFSIYSVTLKYLEKGHTYMSADAHHHLISREIQKRKVIADFDQFVHVVRAAKVNPIVMSHNDFRDWPKGTTTYKLSKTNSISNNACKMANISIAQFTRGSQSIGVCSELDGQLRYFDIFTSSLCSTLPPTRHTPRGINEKKKQTIIEKLLPFVEAPFRSFWEGLPTSSQVQDLCFAAPTRGDV